MNVYENQPNRVRNFFLPMIIEFSPENGIELMVKTGLEHYHFSELRKIPPRLYWMLPQNQLSRFSKCQICAFHIHSLSMEQVLSIRYRLSKYQIKDYLDRKPIDELRTLYLQKGDVFEENSIKFFNFLKKRDPEFYSFINNYAQNANPLEFRHIDPRNLFNTTMRSLSKAQVANFRVEALRSLPDLSPLAHALCQTQIEELASCPMYFDHFIEFFSLTGRTVYLRALSKTQPKRLLIHFRKMRFIPEYYLKKMQRPFVQVLEISDLQDFTERQIQSLNGIEAVSFKKIKQARKFSSLSLEQIYAFCNYKRPIRVKWICEHLSYKQKAKAQLDFPKAWTNIERSWKYHKSAVFWLFYIKKIALVDSDLWEDAFYRTLSKHARSALRTYLRHKAQKHVEV